MNAEIIQTGGAQDPQTMLIGQMQKADETRMRGDVVDSFSYSAITWKVTQNLLERHQALLAFLKALLNKAEIIEVPKGHNSIGNHTSNKYIGLHQHMNNSPIKLSYVI